MNAIKKALNNGLLIMLILILSSYIYASVFQRIEETPIDDFYTKLIEITSDQVFVDEYNREFEDDSIEEVYNTLDSIMVLKSNYILGPYYFLIALSAYFSNVILIYIMIRLDDRIHHIKKRERFIGVIDETFISNHAYSIQYLIASFESKSA